MLKLITAKRLDVFWQGALEIIKKIAKQETVTTSNPGLMTAEDKKKLDGLGGVATASKPGLMSAKDKEKLDGLGYDGMGLVVDSTISESSANPVQNKAVAAALSQKPDGEGIKFSVDENGILCVTYDEK